MSGYTMTQMEVLYAGPGAYQAAGALTTGYVQAAANATTEQTIMTAASGASGAEGFSQPYLPAGYFQQGRQNQLVKIRAYGLISWVATASTTATLTMGFQSAGQGTATGVPASKTVGTVISSPAIPNNSTSQTNAPWMMEIDLVANKVGYGTTAVSTSLQASGFFSVQAATLANSWTAALTPQVVTTLDSTVSQFVYFSVTFGTNASVSNTCTCIGVTMFGCN